MHPTTKNFHECEEFGGADAVLELLRRKLCPLGFELEPFKVEWYNDRVAPPFRFQMPNEQVGFVILSTPHMFELAIIPHVHRNRHSLNQMKDPLDESVKWCINDAINSFPSPIRERFEVMHDFDMWPNRKPKVLVQTAGHIAGAAYYYQKMHIPQQLLAEYGIPNNRKFAGVSLHPRFGGWFALRGVIFPLGLEWPDLKPKEPIDVLPNCEDKLQLLIEFNRWSIKFRDMIPVEARYSQLQQMYFNTKPGPERIALLESIVSTADSPSPSCDSLNTSSSNSDGENIDPQHEQNNSDLKSLNFTTVIEKTTPI